MSLWLLACVDAEAPLGREAAPDAARVESVGSSVSGYVANHGFGDRALAAGDYDKDGYDDLVVAAPFYGGNAGRVYLFEGGASGVSSSATSNFTGSASNAYFGRSLASCDWDQDGYDDLAIGAYGLAGYAGRVYYHRGSPSSLASGSIGTSSGSYVNDYFGYSVACGGDVDADGYPDLLVGSYGYDNGAISAAGAIWMINGTSAGPASSMAGITLTYTGYLGLTVASAGDVNGDGYADALAGGFDYWGDGGAVTDFAALFYGSSAGMVTDGATYLYADALPYDAEPFGSMSNVVAGDFDGDGYGDIALGEPQLNTNKGRVYVWYGGPEGPATSADLSYDGEGSNHYFGWALAAGDLDADGYDELVVGAPDASTTRGGAWIYRGSSAGLDSSADVELSGSSVGDTLGSALLAGFDIDGDDIGDLAVGLPGAAYDLGRVDVYHGVADRDGDGHTDEAEGGDDCDDTDASISPSASEVAGDGVDQDCDGVDDCYLDLDGDGWAGSGTGAGSDLSCDESGTSTSAEDCDDSDDEVHPGASEGVADGVDADCDGAELCWEDADGDGHGGDGTVEDVVGCAGAADSSDDCDDTRADVSPSATEVCDAADTDEDCDGKADDLDSASGLLSWYRDRDGDGYGGDTTTLSQCEQPSGYSATADDCDDYDGGIHPDATEVCDAADTDEDCDGLSDDADPDVSSASFSTFYEDEDADGWGSESSWAQCDAPSGYTDTAGDCDDADAARNPGAPEVCDGAVDEDCDELVDDADPSLSDPLTWYSDSDGDGWGDAAQQACVAPAGTVAEAGDCDDADATVNPGATEVCGGADEDCDGLSDDADPSVGDASTWHADADGDGFGDAATADSACVQPAGWLADASDCDDADAAVNPDGLEVCGGGDEDCDGLVDGEDPDVDASSTVSWYADADGDGYGDEGISTDACSAPEGHVGEAGDCDDADPEVHPGAEEVCDGGDDDCDGDVDEDATVLGSWYADADGDGFGDPALLVASCSPPDGYVDDDSDCDDSRDSVHPGADEICDELDQDCDGEVDEEAIDAETFWVDGDGDGYGAGDGPTSACANPEGYVENADDCDDAIAAIHPGAEEICDGFDQDCDDLVDDDATDAITWYEDADGDGYGDDATALRDCQDQAGMVELGGDCDDGREDVFPGAVDVCDNRDDDCDGEMDEDADFVSAWTDADGDGFGDPATETSTCAPGDDLVTDATDCDDADAAVNPLAGEVCDNGLDDDCDAEVDEDCKLSGVQYCECGGGLSPAAGLAIFGLLALRRRR